MHNSNLGRVIKRRTLSSFLVIAIQNVADSSTNTGDQLLAQINQPVESIGVDYSCFVAEK
ncbi:MAG TPA: hypothetical protein PKD88_10685 [Nitrosomonas sp.]|nr:hypothetical protein [Nitrosomonas sp.]HMW21460.1 hypothetical protein [Nitrosomonas sp.]HMW69546.1 hypothetical protein [Nitrosomonas sp.]HMY62156.1 hypothetical protein [Nitrosomonas sp.]HMY90871.1 hypothetical protein [Nitrosomonas sp.]